MHPDCATGDVELLDAGDGRRLDRFGDRVVDRPALAAGARRRDPAAWARATLRYDHGAGWSGVSASEGSWPVSLAGVRLLLRPASGGQLGCFPEHAVTATWIAGLAAADRDDGAPVRLLNLFAYTGLVSLAAAAAGATVVHVDASRTVVEWGRANAALGGLDQAPIRWIVDDAAAFTAREVRRERRYDAIVIDPPTYGHGSGGRDWRIDRDLPSLLDLASRLLAPGGYLRLSAHTRALEPDRLADMAAGALGIRPRAVGLEPLRLIASSGAVLDLGVLATARR